MSKLFMVRVEFDDKDVITYPASDEDNAQRICTEASEVFENWENIEVYSCEVNINLLEFVKVH